MIETFHPKDNGYKGKIVSLIASTTEIICALGLEKNLIGISHECDFPENILDLPRCSSSKIRENFSSIKIEKSVKRLIENALSVYSIDSEKLYDLSPDIIFTQDMCKVCAVSRDDIEIALNKYMLKSVNLYSYSPNILNEIFDGILEIGKIVNKSESARNLVVDIKIRIKSITEESNRIKKKPSVCAIEWIEPIYIAGNWMPELIEIAGGNSIFSQPGDYSSIIPFSKIVEQDPDFILIMPCGWAINKIISELSPLLERPEWNFLKAVRNSNVYILDGNQYFNRPGPRIIDSIEILTEIFHPWKFIHEFEGKGWIKYGSNKKSFK